ncbi:MAG TPA: S24 family peptidase [Anaerolineales bacterium]|nr:S24 family peptidase [Anaerolineales bacterium]
MFDPESTYQWLGRDNVPLDFASQELVKSIHTSIAAGDFDRALDLLDDLKAASGRLDDCARASVHIECARAFQQMNVPEQAIQELETAARLLDGISYPSQACRHNLAVVNWMLGAFFWSTPGQRQIAIETWQHSLDLFQTLIHDPNTLDPAPMWYAVRLAEMKVHFGQAMQSPQPIPVSTGPGGWPVSLPRVVLQPGSLKSIAVLGNIPAGGFAPSGTGPQPSSRVRLQPTGDEFLIDGIPHHLFNLRGNEQIITLQSSFQYYILWVQGDSMDMTGIQPGDYVLLRYQDSAVYGDIVAAEILNVDGEATLKSFTRILGTHGEEIVLLLPLSNNQEHQPFTFTIDSQEFFIRGVALGVFKPTA